MEDAGAQGQTDAGRARIDATSAADGPQIARRPGRARRGPGCEAGGLLRFFALGLLAVLGAVATLAGAIGGAGWLLLGGALLVLVGVGVHGLVQTRYSILRNDPVPGHVRFLVQSVRPELQQHFVERNFGRRPSDRNTRTSVHQRA